MPRFTVKQIEDMYGGVDLSGNRGNVSDIDNLRRIWIVGDAQCLGCGNIWTAVVKFDAIGNDLECFHCDQSKSSFQKHTRYGN